MKCLPFSGARNEGITAQRHFDDYSTSNETRQLPTACLELGQGGAMEMGGNTRKEGVALPLKKSPRIREGSSEASLMEFQGGQGRARRKA